MKNVLKDIKKLLTKVCLKIMAKLGISVIKLHIEGDLILRLVGLSRSMVNEYFPSGVQSRISGIGLSGIEYSRLINFINMHTGDVVTLPIGGIYRYRNGGETHAYDGKLIHLLQTAVGSR